EVEDADEMLADFFASDGLRKEFGDGVQALFNFGAGNGGAKNPRAQKTGAHAGRGLVERGEERGGRVVARRGGDQFEIADGDVVEDERVLLLVVGDAAEMLETGAAGPQEHGFGGRRRAGGDCRSLAQIVDKRAGGGSRLGVAGEAKAIERDDAKLLFEDSPREIVLENPLVETRFGGTEAVELLGGRLG